MKTKSHTKQELIFKPHQKGKTYRDVLERARVLLWVWTCSDLCSEFILFKLSCLFANTLSLSLNLSMENTRAFWANWNSDSPIIVDYLLLALPVNVGTDIRTDPRKFRVSFFIVPRFLYKTRASTTKLVLCAVLPFIRREIWRGSIL